MMAPLITTIFFILFITFITIQLYGCMSEYNKWKMYEQMREVKNND